MSSVVTTTQARAKLYSLINEVSVSHSPVVITGKHHNAVLVSEEDWASIQEMLHLAATPGMHESIKKGLETPIDQCDKQLDW